MEGERKRTEEETDWKTQGEQTSEDVLFVPGIVPAHLHSVGIDRPGTLAGGPFFRIQHRLFTI